MIFERTQIKDKVEIVYKIVEGSTHNLPDIENFITMLNTLDHHPTFEAQHLFDPNADLIVTRTPGRLDVMGGIADYSGSLVLQLPIREATLVALQRDSSPELQIVSLGADSNHRTASFHMPLADFETDSSPIEYEVARSYFQRHQEQHWAAYVAGAFLVLRHERNITFSKGARLLITSDVPEGKGVSSSAALEVAAMQAIATAFGITIEPREMALLCQKVENLVVGAPCGVMDQMTAACGQPNRLLSLLCQPAELQEMVTLPDDIAVWGLDSGIRHSVSGADYGSVRVGAFMGYRLIAEQAGLEIKPSKPGMPIRIIDPHWSGYLANLTPSEFQQFYAQHLPEAMTGDEFLIHYGGTTDPVTQIDPGKSYEVRIPTAHPIHEHFRVRSFAQLLKGTPGEQQLELLGELMYQSHASYSACGLGSSGTDRLVELVREAGPQKGLYGAKITGGGSGGTVAVLGQRGVDASLEAIAEQYAHESGYQPHIFSGSSPGVAVFGHLKLKWG